jgi:hypothetical protein
MRKSIEERFKEKYVVDEVTGCWLWIASKKETGYAQFADINNRPCRAHRWAYQHFVRLLAPEEHLDHLCRIRHCVNPEHLEPVTKLENDYRGESPCAKNRRKTHCNKGHEFSEENTYVYSTGGRKCRRCRTDQMLQYSAEARPYTRRGKCKLK